MLNSSCSSLKNICMHKMETHGALKPSFHLPLGYPSIEFTSATNRSARSLSPKWCLPILLLPTAPTTTPSTWKTLNNYLKIPWCHSLILYWMLGLSSKRVEWIFLLMEKKMSFAFRPSRGPAVRPLHAQITSYQFQTGLSVSSVLCPVPRQHIQGPKPSPTSWKRPWSQPVPSSRVLHIWTSK